MNKGRIGALRSLAFGTCSFAALVSMAAQPALAQDADDASRGDDSELSADRAAEIIVTGSRIRGIAPVGSNVLSVGQEQLATTGAVTTQDLVAQLPQNISSGFNEASFSNPFSQLPNGTRAGAVNLRGVGPQATLVLLNGHRVVPGGTQGAMIDPSALPAKAIQRLEVIADGASAIYGADAVAGVVNIILRRDLDGFEAEGRYGFADDFDQWSINFAAGKRWSTGQIMVSYEHSRKSALAGADRDWFTADNRGRGGTDYRQFQCNPGTVKFGTATYPVPASGPVTPATLVAGAPNRCDLTGMADIAPFQNRDVVAATVSQQLTDGLKFTGEGFFMHRRFSADIISQSASTTQISMVMPQTNPYFVRPVGAVGPTATIDYSFAPQFGPLVSSGFERSYGIIAGLEASLPGGWSAALHGSYGHNDAAVSSATINRVALQAMLNSTDPAVALNPFAPLTQAQYDAIFTGVFAPRGTNTLKMAELRADGPLFDLPAGAVRAAVGGEYYKLTNSSAPIQGTVSAPIFNPVSSDRTVKSVYGELFLPIIDNADGMTLSASAALRYDHYSDVGDTTNTKFGLTFEPVEGVSLRASYGTSFRAPLLSDMIEAKGGSLISVGGVRNDVNGPQTVAILVAGNPDVRPEEATTWSLGATIAPVSAPGLEFVVNYFNLDYSAQIISLLTDNTVLQRRAIYGSLVREFTPGLTPAQVQADPEVARLLAMGIPLQGALPPSTRFIIDARPYNLGKTKTDGFDFTVAYRTDLGGGRLSTSLNGAYYLSFKVQQTDTAPVIEEINHYQYPLRFKARGTVNWSDDLLGFGVYVNYANSYSVPTSLTRSRVRSHMTVDLHGSVKLPLVNETTLALDITNVFDRKPPFVDIDGGYDPAHASALGRMIQLSLRTKF